MLADRDKISLRQAMFLFVTITTSPAIRLFPTYTARAAKQAGWLSAFVAFAVMLVVVHMLHKVYQKYQEASYIEVMYAILGRVIGKAVVVLYILWVIIYLGLYIRFFGERLKMSILPDVNMSLFLITMLLLIAYCIRSGIAVIARMNEILLPLILVIFFLMCFFIFPEVELRNLTPISKLDILPVFKGSLGILSIWCYLILIFLFSDKINNKENIKKSGTKALILLLVSCLVLIISNVGSLGSSVTARLPLPFFVATKQISLFNTIEKIESIVVTVWLSSDFIIIIILTYIFLHLFKTLFNLSDSKPFINIFMVFSYFFALYICNSRYELEQASSTIYLPANVILLVILPLLIFCIGKIRKKI